MKIISKNNNIFKVEGTTGVYEVKLNPFDCTCRDYIYRKEPKGQFCKHIEFVLSEVKK